MRFLLSFAAICACVSAGPGGEWTVARSAHFEVYSQTGEEAARSAIGWFEQLRAFFVSHTSLELDHRPPVRVIGFRSVEQYRDYRMRPTADAYYMGTESRDYIVMPSLGASQFRVAAHEYAHVLMHARGLRLPSWLSEGLAEFFSTIRITAIATTVGGDLPVRSQALRGKWMGLSELLSITGDSPMRNDRARNILFYDESWAMVHMLLLSPRYSPRFPALMTALIADEPGPEALTRVYGESLDAIERDAHAWMDVHRATVAEMPGVPAQSVVVEASTVPPLESRLVLGELLFDADQVDRAEAVYRDLAREAPGLAAVSAGLGAIALRRGDREGARKEWRRAMEQGVGDASICYRYAALAHDAGMDADEIRPALRRAIMLQPDFDDARYSLALLEKNIGNYEAAVEEFRAMKVIAPLRAFNYWSALADALNDLGMRDDAKAAAHEAARHASTPSEHAHASRLAYVADTDLAVRFTRDANGRAQLETTRAPHNQPDFNPFIEPDDRIRRVEATIEEIRCDAQTRFAVRTTEGLLVLSVPDPSRVQMRNAPPEFVCGVQSPRAVKVEYAVIAGEGTNGIVRGIEFR